MTTNEIKHETNANCETQDSQPIAGEVTPSLPSQPKEGSRRTRPMTEKAARRKMGWAMTMFCEARFDIVRRHLSPEAQAKWDSISYAKSALWFKPSSKRAS